MAAQGGLKLPYEGIIEVMILHRFEVEEVMDWLARWQIPMPDEIAALVAFRREALVSGRQYLGKYLDGAGEQVPRRFRDNYRFSDLLDPEVFDTHPVLMLADSERLRKIVEILGLGWAFKQGGLPRRVDAEGLNEIAKMLKDISALQPTPETLGLYFALFADTEHLSWLDWRTFFDSVPKGFGELHRKVVEHQWDDLTLLLGIKTEGSLIRLAVKILHDRLSRMAAKQFDLKSVAEILRLVDRFRSEEGIDELYKDIQWRLRSFDESDGFLDYDDLVKQNAQLLRAEGKTLEDIKKGPLP